jgi:hypothetical protein
MIARINIFALMLTSLALFPPSAATAQDTIPTSMRADVMPRQRLAGPRFGFTRFTGDVARFREAYGYESLMSQFGWQFETQIVSTSSGNQALMEWVVLVGGVEQEELNLSVSWLAGYRLPNGFEFGVGPNVNLPMHNEEPDPTTSMVMAFGTTQRLGELYVPVNMAISFAQGGPRYTMLMGWIIGG